MAKPKMQSAGPVPSTKRLIITKEQADSLARHENAVTAATQIRNAVLEGIMTGHGHTSVQVTDFDHASRTLAFVTLEPPKVGA